MIHVERMTAPSVMTSPRVMGWREEAQRFFLGPAKKIQEKFEFQSLATFENLKEALSAQFHGKCAYCERAVGFGEFDIEFFRPRSHAVGLTGKVDDQHYWWLAYEWSNLMACCRNCGSYKGTRFPVEGSRSRYSEDVSSERPLLLDPCVDYPEQHLSYDQFGKAFGLTQRGNITIDVLNLNSEFLLREREQAYQDVYTQLAMTAVQNPEQIETFFRTQAQPYHAYSGIRRAALRSITQQSQFSPFASLPELLPGPVEQVQSAVPTTGAEPPTKQVKAKRKAREKKMDDFNVASNSVQAKTAYYSKTRYVERVEIKNFKIIDDLDLRISPSTSDSAPWMVLLGENGVGKSTFLQALSLTLLSPEDREALNLDARRFVRHGQRSGFVRVHLSGDSMPVEMTFSKGSSQFEGPPAKVLMLAYGATRLLARKGAPSVTPSPNSGAGKAAHLFNPFEPLINPNEWLSSLPRSRFNDLATDLKELLLYPPEAKMRIRNRTTEPYIQIENDGDRVRFEELSDGYQSALALVADVMSILIHRWPSLEVAEGILLIDELGAHLHPQWRLRIVGMLRKHLPRLQVFASTHDPLCLWGLHQGEVALLRYDEEEGFVMNSDLPDPSEMSVEQILTSPLFGLGSTIAPNVADRLDKYYKSLTSQELSPEDQAKAARAKAELDSASLLGQTPRERLFYELIDKELAQMEVPPPSADAMDTASMVQDLWAQVQAES